jgi:hypothetical protein
MVVTPGGCIIPGMRRVIDFYVQIDQLHEGTRTEPVRVGFDWSGEGDVMAPAFRALEQEIGNIPLLIEYYVNDWEWIQ